MGLVMQLYPGIHYSICPPQIKQCPCHAMVLYPPQSLKNPCKQEHMMAAKVNPNGHQRMANMRVQIWEHVHVPQQQGLKFLPQVLSVLSHKGAEQSQQVELLVVMQVLM